jgi:hypothetical protein
VNNECFGNVMAGIGTESGAKAIIRDNKCYKNLMAGIGARTKARPIISGNECYENLMAGIGCEDNARPIIHDNKCSKNELAGIGVQKGVKALIIENECHDNKTAGIGVREKASAVILNNKCVENKLVAIGVRNGSDVRIAGNQLERTGGMPPMIAVREDSSAVITGNTIKGGGVAGVMLQGTATIADNSFFGNGPRRGGPPNFAAWIHGGSTVSFQNNSTDGWRHALFASGANRVLAIDNTAANFIGTAIVINESKLPAHVVGNVAISNKKDDQAVRVKGLQGAVAENLKRTPVATKERLKK